MPSVLPTFRVPNVHEALQQRVFGLKNLISSALVLHNHTSAADDGGVLTNDEHDGYSDYAEIADPGTPVASHKRLWVQEVGGKLFFVAHGPDDVDLVLARDNVIVVRNESGSTIETGRAVYLDGGSTGQTPEISLAQADDVSTMPAIGLVLDEMDDGEFGRVMIWGRLRVNTSNTNGLAFDAGETWAEGDLLYVNPDTPGLLTNVMPSDPDIVQRVGVLAVDGVGNGAIVVTQTAMILPDSGGSSPTTTLGDLIRNDGGGNGSDERLPIGSSGQVLTVVSGEPEWATIGASGGASGASEAYARRAAIYTPFTEGTDDDEFNDASFSGWTAVENATPVLTITESHDALRIYHPGNDAAAQMHGFVKTPSSFNTGKAIEIAFRGLGVPHTNPLMGLVMANGTTYGAGAQVWARFNINTPAIVVSNMTNWNTAGSSSTLSINSAAPGTGFFMRLTYDAANTFSVYMSPDGVTWVAAHSAKSYTLTPTVLGFCLSSWSGTVPWAWAIRYIKITG